MPYWSAGLEGWPLSTSSSSSRVFAQGAPQGSFGVMHPLLFLLKGPRLESMSPLRKTRKVTYLMGRPSIFIDAAPQGTLRVVRPSVHKPHSDTAPPHLSGKEKNQCQGGRIEGFLISGDIYFSDFWRYLLSDDCSDSCNHSKVRVVCFLETFNVKGIQ
ncbi:hypothetical protein CDAR_579191 [Caerostris darwini]|uniref:Uncharacterized protein n=1 Tax=Caerostris darwini TaxID=1538125 RepID=A0AAV4RQA2_9ARAC|nr:hypothetical protein CDAR_579191 [Caerostris darwini]